MSFLIHRCAWNIYKQAAPQAGTFASAPQEGASDRNFGSLSSLVPIQPLREAKCHFQLHCSGLGEMSDNNAHPPQPPAVPLTTENRTPRAKACTFCRSSKHRCDGQDGVLDCSRCVRNMRKVCMHYLGTTRDGRLILLCPPPHRHLLNEVHLAGKKANGAEA